MQLIGKVCIDTNIIIYLIEGNPLYKREIEAFKAYFESDKMTVVSSDISEMELLTGFLKRNHPSLADHYLYEIRDYLIDDYIPVSKAVLLKAAEIRATSRLKSMDAIHLASAITANCDIFLTNDRSFTTDALDIAYFDELT
jgi:predicted nucleic acid-binding protein